MLHVDVAPGDVLYLPCAWWHCVEGSAERNMILNWWCVVHEQKRAAGEQDEGGVAGRAPPYGYGAEEVS